MQLKNDEIQVGDAPAIAGLTFRRFRGEEDYPKMIAVIAASAEADKIERVDTVEDVARVYSHLVNCDPYQDMIFAEINDEVIAYSRGSWFQEENGPRIYASMGFLVPAWRRKGIGSTLLRWVENRLRAIADSHAIVEKSFLQGFADSENVGLATMLEKNGYKPIRYVVQMVRPNLENIPDFQLPDGLDVRPVLPEHYRAIWEADAEAFRDHWGYAEPTEVDYKDWQENKIIFQPDLWQIAWDKNTNEVAGQVRTYINASENEKFNRKRGYTEFISVRRPWRKQGVARALIVRSLRLQKERGMTESALGADSENISGATRVYEDCGFHVTKRSAIYRKPIKPNLSES
ncbi:MAG TPA: GNAT family N-acetyltransferase [Anaerolineales bacterium]|nr:GNAT family N-acetyltransferase [Anaerolineales bacterium]